ncbi:metabolite traffic protein EboE [Streptomyces paromomycinus]|uniref:Xylose isomerase n=1 Tax=Streptomyces paromomycinus TaxID=92743 RepID=A0A401VWV9_STREY|nr:metabolite traffic protein EboE [Streptomyces paromomycinus]GCD41572.1 xylose isomerase [Streptomyces paromomycinus]
MRFRHPDGSTVHLAYCTNVHPAETLDGVLAQLRDHCEPVRKRLGRDRLGIGLWLARDAARALVHDSAALRGLRRELDIRGLEVVTLNGFPYRGFGDSHVKYRVYRPDWTEPARLDHTADLARLLAALLPDDLTEGTISTLPLAWRTDFDAVRDAATRHATALTALHTLAGRLDALEELTGRSIRVGLEPEPGCLVETTADAVEALGHGRSKPSGSAASAGPAASAASAASAGLTASAEPVKPTDPTDPTEPTELTGLTELTESTEPTAPPPHRIGVCVDTCHLATSFEDPHTALEVLGRSGVPVVKAQLSAALHAEHPGRPDVRAALGAFAEPRFLHQTRTRTPDGRLRATDDLHEALAGEDAGGLPDTAPWRAHFHVPLHAPPEPPLTSTLPVLRATLALLVGGPVPRTRHLEVETYTWQALPPGLRPRSRSRLADGIAAELALARDLLADLGLKELP